jgi:hypothetical protein
MDLLVSTNMAPHVNVNLDPASISGRDKRDRLPDFSYAGYAASTRPCAFCSRLSVLPFEEAVPKCPCPLSLPSCCKLFVIHA